jgi:hypothetical protein
MFFFENFFRFRNKFLKKININPSHRINFGSKKANDCFEKILKKSNFYFEFGSGNSTILAEKINKDFISVELDKTFFDKISLILKNKKKIKYIDIGPVGEFSYPLIKDKSKIIKYVKSINKYFNKKKFPSLILVDGRFRVACCINIFFLIKKYKHNPIIVLDDYKKRNEYKILDKIFNIKLIGRMAFLKVKNIKNLNTLQIDDYIFESR